MLLERQKIWSDVSLVVTSIMYQYSSFFMLGGSNSISSVDLSNAYNGVSGYNVLAVGVLTFVSNWAGPIWWASAICRIRSQQQVQSAGHFALLTLFTSVSTLAMMLACMLLREHLFIWTVFSPKVSVYSCLGVASACERRDQYGDVGRTLILRRPLCN